MVLLWSETKSSIIIMVCICPKDGINMAPDQNFLYYHAIISKNMIEIFKKCGIIMIHI